MSLLLSLFLLAPALAGEVVAIYPSTDVLPQNHLRFYVDFSERMPSPRDLFAHLSLVDETTGETVEGAFAETPIWNRARTRLTVLLHPGRQKTDVGFGGKVLEVGHAYTLRIDETLAATEKRFTVGPMDRIQPDPETWSTQLPEGPEDPLVVFFDEPLDASYLPYAFEVGDLPLDVALGHEERSVRLTTPGGWPAGELDLRRVETVEDLAANSPERAFERRAGTSVSKPMPFEVRFTSSLPTR